MQRTTVEREIVLANKAGLHARPATQLVETAGQFKSDITLSKDGFEVSGKSIMGILMLAAECGATLKVKATGEDSEKALDAIASLIGNKFGEE